MKLPPPGLSGSENDHQFRSRFIQWLLHQPPPPPESSQIGGDPIPRVLVQYWHDLKHLPDDVQECLKSWESLRSHGFRRLIFDDERARSFISKHFTVEHVEAFDLCYHPAMRCDYFRLCYIFRCGGFYVDADEVYQGTGCEAFFNDNNLKIQPLCYDIATDAMVKPEMFLKDTTYLSSRIFYVNNNPIIGPAGHELIRLAIERSTRILLQRSERPEIQSTTGPGNLSASLVKHAIRTKVACREWDFLILSNWEYTSVCRWSLSYRNDERNWRFLNNLRHT
jgi:mannosyltransferase OCH1-like enzyme